MDRRPLLSSIRVTARGPAPPQQLLLPSQVDTSLVVFEDDVDGARNSTHPSSEARTSRFSSFSAWSEGTVAAIRSSTATTHSYVVACLLRPFQQLSFWCCGSERRCCCCLGRSSSPSSAAAVGFDSNINDDDFNYEPNEVVAADALRASGVSRGSQRSKGGTPTTVPHRGSRQQLNIAGASNSGRNTGSWQHRQYAPPRSHSHEAGLGSPGATALAGEVADSVAGSSFAGSSTPPSSIALSRVATAPGEHLVMHRGVLMRIAADGSCTRVADEEEEAAAAMALSGQRNTHGTHDERLSLRALDGGGGQADSLTEQMGAAVAPRHGGSADVNRSAQESDATAGPTSPYAVAMTMDALEAARQPLRSLEQLSFFLGRLAPYLPLRVEMELDLNSSSSLSAIRGDAVSSTTPAPTAVPLCAHVLGPVQPAPTAAALRLLEDLLIEDCDHNRLCINALHCADLDLRGVAVGGEETLDLARRSGSTSGIEEGNLRAQSNAFLDLLVSPVTANARRTAGASPGGKLEGGVASTALSAAAATTHVVTFLNNFVKGRGPQLTTLHFTRCFVVPHDMSRFVPLPLRTIRRLRYEHCSLTPAHIDALLTLARNEDSEPRNVGRGAAGCVSRPFGMLEELQLSGPLTSECIAELLDYIEEQQLAVTEGSNTAVALRQVVLPSALVRVAKEHSFIQAHSHRICVVSAN